MLCPNFGPARPLGGGAERQAEKLARALRARGCAVEVLAPRDDPAWPAHYEVNGVAVRTFPLHDLSRVMRRGAGIPNVLLRGAQTRAAVRAALPGFDVLHCHMASAFTAAAVLEARRAGVPTVCKPASGGPTFDLAATAAIAPGAGRLARRMVRRVDRWAAISGQIRDDLLAWGVPEERVARIPNGVEPVAAPPLPADGVARCFLYLGRMTPDRDFAPLLEGFAALLDAVPDAELALVGGGPLEDEVRARVAALPGAAGRVRVEGHADPAPWLAWAHAVVQPSRSEGMSNTLLEALSAGRACTATDIPPNREVLDGGRLGLLAAPGSGRGWADALRRLAAEPGLAARLGAAGRAEVAAVYAMEVVADRYLALYAGLRARSGAR
jgi:glycosyltransferase involved in cell wall biosynthesis